MNSRYLYVGAGTAALLGLLAFFNWLSTPSLSIETPTGSAVCEPIPVAVSWGGKLQSMKAMVSNTPPEEVVLSLDQASQRATGLTEGHEGARVLTVTADLKPRFLSGLYPVRTLTETRSFTVKRPDLTFQPPSLSLTQAGSGAATVSRECMTLATPLTVALSSNTSSVASAPTSVTLAMQAKSAPLQVTAGMRFGLAKISASALHHSKAFASTVPLAVTVKRQVGAFARVNPSFATPNGSLSSPNGQFSVLVGPAITNPTPPPVSTFEAQFKRAANSQNIGSDIPFAIGSLGGGAGFCAASWVGAVFSGYPQGVTSDYVFNLLYLRSGSPVVRQYEARSRSVSTTGTPFFYRPTLLLSPDCSLALIAGAHPTSVQEPHQLNGVDVPTGTFLPGCEIAFGGLDDATDLAASVVDNTVSGKQEVEVKVGGVVVDKCVIP